MSLLRISFLLALYWIDICSSRTCQCLFFTEEDCDRSTECKWSPDNSICRSIQWVFCEMDEKCKEERELRKMNKEVDPDFDWPFDCPQWYEGQVYIADDVTASPTETMTTSLSCEDAGALEGKTCKCAKYGACIGLDCEPGPDVFCDNGGLCCCGDTCSAEEGGDAPGGKTPPQGPPQGAGPPPGGQGGQPPPQQGGGQQPPPQQGGKQGGGQNGAPPPPQQTGAPPPEQTGAGGSSTSTTKVLNMMVDDGDDMQQQQPPPPPNDAYDPQQPPPPPENGLDEGEQPPPPPPFGNDDAQPPPFDNDDAQPPPAKIMNVMDRRDIGSTIRFGYGEIFGTFIVCVASIGILALCCKSIINYRTKEEIKRLGDDKENRYKYATFEQV